MQLELSWDEMEQPWSEFADGPLLQGWINVSVRDGAVARYPLGGWWVTTTGQLLPYDGQDCWGDHGPSGAIAALRAVGMGDGLADETDQDELAERVRRAAATLAREQAKVLAAELAERWEEK